MGVIFSAIHGALNLVLPFTNPSTPLLQDLIHTIILCGTLYYAPQIVDAYNRNNYAQNGGAIPHDPAQETSNVPGDENLMLQPETDDDDEGEHDQNFDHAPPPLAPTPPPGGANIPHAHAEDADQFVDNGQWQDPAHFENEAGPANPPPRPAHANRTIGTKKAKSIARRDQRRAYHEFHRSQAEQRRAEEESTREEREAALAEAKARRAEEERRIAEKQRVERERKKEEERREAEEERERRDRVVATVREQVEQRGAVNLVKVAYAEGKDRVWIEKLVRASGMVAAIEKASGGGKCKVMITGEGWMVRVDEELMKKAYADAVAYGDGEGRDGRVSFEDFGDIVERAVLARAKAAV